MALLLVSTLSVAEEEPFTRVGPYREDAGKVLLFFSYSCSYCQRLDPGFAGWGTTLPPRFIFERVPVVTASNDYVVLASAHYAAAMVAPEKHEIFVRALYDAVATYGATPQAVAQAVAVANIDKKKFTDAMKSQAISKKVDEAYRLTRKYKVDSTPALAIAGRFSIDMEKTNGEPKAMVQLANGLISSLLPGYK